MAGGRQPTNVIIANGRKHLTKEEIAERLAAEVQPVPDGISAPGYLTAAQKKRFNELAAQLKKIKIMGETDCDALARYVTAQAFYEDAVKELRRLAKDRPKDTEAEDYFNKLETWTMLTSIADRRQDRYFKQAQTAAASLGLTISSRCKLVVPVKEEAPKENKFAKFGAPVQGKAANGG